MMLPISLFIKKTAKPMNYRSLFGLALLLFATGCSNTVSDRPSADLSSSPSTSPGFAVQRPASPSLPSSTQPLIKPSAPPATAVPARPQGQTPQSSASNPPK
jgi:hypothetical protein